MKHVVAIYIFGFFSAPFMGIAQSADSWTLSQAKPSIGVKVGLNVNQLKGLAIYKQKTSKAIGFQAGVYSEIPLSSHISLQPEANFSTQRTHIDKNDGAAPLSQTVVNSFINIPFLAKIHVKKIFYLYTGPQIGILVAAKKKGEIGYDFTNYGSQTYIIEGTADVKNDYRHDVSIVFGAGAHLTNKFSVDIRTNHGLRDINNSSYERNVRNFYDLDLGIYTRGTEISIAYNFGRKQ